MILIKFILEKSSTDSKDLFVTLTLITRMILNVEVQLFSHNLISLLYEFITLDDTSSCIQLYWILFLSNWLLSLYL
jgi:hypothetical protein